MYPPALCFLLDCSPAVAPPQMTRRATAGSLAGVAGTYKDRVIRLCELVAENGVLTSVRFDHCDIKGPAVVVLQDSTLSHSNLGSPSADAILWEIPLSRPVVVGAILAKDCVFDRCTFFNVGFAGPPTLIQKIRAGSS